MKTTLTIILNTFFSIVLFSQCNLVLDSVVQQNVSCNGGSNGEFTAFASGGTAPYTFNTEESFSALLPVQPFNSNVINNNTTAPTNVWFSPGSCSGGAAFIYNAASGCPPGAAVYNGTFSGFGGCFLRSPTVNMNGIDEAVIQFDFSNSFTASRPNDRMRIYIWVNGGYQSSLPTTINGTAGNTIFFTELRTCQAMEARINLSSIPTNSRSDFMVYFEANCGYSNCSPFQAILDNIAIGQGAPGQASATFSNLAANTYPLVITDADGCSVSTQVVITQPAILTGLTNVQDVSTVNGSDGSISIIPSGGTAPYTLTWNTVPPQIITGLSNIPQGNYSFTLTDANNCSTNLSALVGGPDCSTLNLTVESIINPTCANPNGGSFLLLPQGGVEPYTFTVNETEFLLNEISQLPANDYAISVMDAAGCSFQYPQAITLTLPDFPALVLNITHPTTVGGDNGTAEAFVSGGTPPFTFSWSNGESSPSIENLAAAELCLSVVDANGCETEQCEFLVNPDCSAFVISSVVATNPTCFESFDGSISIGISGGLAPFQIELNQVIMDAEVFENLNPGTYEIFIVDQAICTLTTQVELFSQGPETPEIIQFDNILQTGIYAAYQWYVNGEIIDGATEQEYELSSSGLYQVQVSDASGCSVFSAELDVIFTNTKTYSNQNLIAFPNPANEVLHIELPDLHGKCELKMIDISGKKMFENSYFSNSFSINTSNLSIGIYLLSIQTDKGIKQMKISIIH